MSDSAHDAHPARTVVDQIDPERLVPGGTDTCIADLIKYSPEGRVRLVGVTAGNLRPGVWVSVKVGERSVPFLPVARLDRSAPSGLARWLPHSLCLALGLFVYRRRMTSSVVQAHRIEIGAILSFLLPRSSLVQFIHNDSAGLLGRNSDSQWRHLRLLYRILERHALSRAKRIVLFNRTDAPRIRAQRPDLTIAQTWYDPTVFYPLPTAAPDLLRVLWVGRLENQKDPLLAIKVAQCLASQRVAFRLELVGAGSLEEAMRTAIDRLDLRHHVHLVGSLSRTEVAKKMRGASALLMTSHYEGSPRVLVEANAVGLPVVATPEADPDFALDGVDNGVRSSREAEQLAHDLKRASGFDRSACVASVSTRSAGSAIQKLMTL